MVKGRRQSIVLDAVISILSGIVSNFIYDKAKSLNWSRIKPILTRVAIEGAITTAAGVVVLLTILYFPLAP